MKETNIDSDAYIANKRRETAYTNLSLARIMIQKKVRRRKVCQKAGDKYKN